MEMNHPEGVFRSDHSYFVAPARTKEATPVVLFLLQIQKKSLLLLLVIQKKKAWLTLA
jgi:hypothetical protein